MLRSFLQLPENALPRRPRLALARVSMDFGVFAFERDRWFLWVPVLFAIGIALYFQLLFEPSLTEVLAPLIAALLARGFCTPHHTMAIVLNALLIIASGATAAKLRTELVRAPVLTTELASTTVTGRIDQVEIRPDLSKRITLTVDTIADLEPRETPARIRIHLRASSDKLNPGDTIRIGARLAPPPAPALPNGFDFARAAYFMSLGAVGYAVSKPTSIVLDQPPGWDRQPSLFLQNLRRHIGDRIERALPGEVGIMANALMTGERSGITKATNDLYRDAGIFHILSISGLHMAIMGGSVFVAIRFLLALFPMIALRYPIKKWAAVAAAIASLAYLLISGAAHPAVRSFLMIVIMFLAIVLDRPALSLRNVALAALLILAVTPESLFNVGFQLSFAAVTALVAAYESYEARARRRRNRGTVRLASAGPIRWLADSTKFLAATITTTIIAGLATAPIAAFHFHTSQQYSVLTNMLAIPVSNILVMPAALAAFIAMPFGLETLPLLVMGFGIDIMTWSARQVTALPGAVAAIPAYSEHALQMMLAGALWFAIWRSPWRWSGLILIAAGIHIATLTERPKAYIGKAGALVALRGPDGRLAANKTRGASYDLRRWLETDGDTRKPDHVSNVNTWRCDIEGCTGSIGRHVIAHAQTPAALTDDCRNAAIIVMPFPKPPGCTTSAIVIDADRIKKHGPHTIYLDRQGDTLRIENVEQFRGKRPWTLSGMTHLERQHP